MPKPSKSTKTDVAETTPAVSTAAPSTTQSAAPKTKAPKKTSAESAVASVVAAPVSSPAPAPAPAPSADVVPEVVDTDSAELTAQTVEFLSKLNQLSTLFASLKTEFRSLEKKWGRELKIAQKSQAKRKRKSGNRQPSGFVKPTKISDELAKFLEKPTGTEMARTDVTREINKYIRSHNLQDKENGRKINPDAKLQSLLKLKKNDELTYFNLQTYMAPHFAKTVKPVAAEKTAPSSV
jgi:chromatin remodeling complex protein RSC6